jgi:hypothetical protein
MAGELAIHLTTGLAHTTVEIIPPDANYGWDGSQAVLWSNLTLSQWQGGLVTLTEAVLSTGERTGLYRGDFPAASTLGKFGIRVRNTPSPTPASEVIAIGTIDWNGSREAAFPPNLEKLGINASGHVSRVTLVDTCTANTDMRGTDGAYTGTPPSVEQIQSGLATLANQLTVLERLTAARAEYLDKLNVAGDLANTANASSFKATGFAVPGSPMTLTSDERNAVADAVLSRDVANAEASAAEHSLCTIVLASLESSISGTTWTIKRTDGETTHATKTLTTDETADPITGVS